MNGSASAAEQAQAVEKDKPVVAALEDAPEKKSDEPTVVENTNVEKHEESSETVEKTDNSISVTQTSVSQVKKIYIFMDIQLSASIISKNLICRHF